MPLAEMLERLWNSSRSKLTYVRLDGVRTDRQLNPNPLAAGRHYLRLRLAEMYLRQASQIGVQWHPAVHSLVQLQFGDTQVQVPNIADSTRVGTETIDSGSVIVRNFALTPTLPFNGGVVTIDSGLVSVRGRNDLAVFMRTLSDFAGLLAVPQLSSSLSIARPLAEGIQALFGAGDGQIKLALRETVAANDDVRECYIAVIDAPANQIYADRLLVVGDRLCEGSGLRPREHSLFEQFDHMLFRLEVFERRDDWDGLTSIDVPLREALAYLADDDTDKARLALRRALLAVNSAPELTRADRRIVAEELKARYKDAEDQMHIAGLSGEQLTLNIAMQNVSRSREAALALGDLTLDELLSLD